MTVRAQAGDDDRANFPFIPYDHPAIRYAEQTSLDPVARLEQKLEKGDVKLTFDPRRGYLPDVLKYLGINTDSQVLVFSKTSFQSPRIYPTAPRAIYFTDDAYIGTVQNGEVLEVISLDPKQGSQFYTLDVEKSAQPTFRPRGIECLQCHVNTGTLNVPGVLISSAYTNTDGTAIRSSQEITDHRSPLADRWGGWYVTGTAENLHHRGNAVPRDAEHTQNLTSLEKKFDITPYLAPSSDIVALMTLEHQTRMTDLMTRLGWEARIAAADGKLEVFQARLEFGVNEMVRYMLFADEAKVPGPITGNSTFTESFQRRGPRDRKGRSLRDFDLHKRLFQYPLSYMIYSKTFDGMPELVRDKVYRKLYDVLTGKDSSASFARLSAQDRQNLLEIVKDTKPNLPDYWRPAGVDGAL
jgi:hypothetical protein